VSSRRTKITEDSESSARWALSRCIRARRGYSARWALRHCADRHRGEENSLSSGIWRKNPLKDLHRVVEHPVDSARGCLSEG
jgi:hypothetical protein